MKYLFFVCLGEGTYILTFYNLPPLCDVHNYDFINGAHLFGAIGGMIFVARGNTYLSFLLLVDSLNGGKLLDWLGHPCLKCLNELL